MTAESGADSAQRRESAGDDEQFDATIDWERHWERTDRDELEEMRAAGERMGDRLERYFESFPATLADVGCGPAFMLFELASAHPGSEFFGVDPAGSVLERNRELAADRELSNLHFRRGSLPALDLDREFGCVTCIATLHYVADIQRAIGQLLDTVAPGGTLVFNYPNRHTKQMYERNPEADRERFELVLNGENLLTWGEIERIGGERPRSFWKAVEEPDWRSIGQTNPCVAIDQ